MYIFFLIGCGCGALSLRFIRQTRKSIVGDTCDVFVPRDPSVKITPKILAKFASLNSSIARGALRSRRCLRTRRPQAPAESQVSKRNTRIKRRKIRGSFWGYFDGRSDMKRACFPRPGTSTVRVYKYEKWHFSTFFSSKRLLNNL